jgi:uncharacterized protein (UPF0276 family)
MRQRKMQKSLESLAIHMHEVSIQLNEYRKTDPEAVLHATELMAASMQVWGWSEHLTLTETKNHG